MTRFLVDGMLGRLARWMRLLGLDTAWPGQAADPALVARAVAEDRVLLTRDRRLALRRALRGRVVVIRSEHWREQLAQLLTELPLAAEIRPLCRCSVCNTPLVQARLEELVAPPPPYVVLTQPAFDRCPDCGRVYWPGTHRARIAAELDRLGIRLDPPDPPPNTLH